MQPFPTPARPFPNPAKPGRRADPIKRFLALFSTPPGRIWIVSGLMGLVFLGLGVRLSYVMLSGDQNAPRAGRSVQPPPLPLRADLRDRAGRLLARTLATQSLVASPADIFDPEATARALVRAFPDLDEKTLLARFRSTRSEVRVKRHLTAAEIARFYALGRGGLRLAPDYRRDYPNGALAAHALGYVSEAGRGLAGVEGGLDARLRAGGGALTLAIDAAVQTALEEELAREGATWKAKGAAGVILDAKTGEILALASWPSFDPNDLQHAGADELRNRALVEPYEMGSSIKPFTYAAGLEGGVITPASEFDTRAGIVIGGDIRRDHKPCGPHALMGECLAVSSNVAAAQVAEGLGAERLYALFRAVGFEGALGLETLEGYRAPPLRPDGPVRLAVSAYGYSFQINLVALASAYGALAADGWRAQPSLLKRDPYAPPLGRQVMSPQTARAVRDALRVVVQDGTGKRAAIAGLDVIGKTGTAEKTGANGYDSTRRVADFAAIFPGFAPRYVTAVLLDEPQGAEGEAGGGAAAAPLAGRVIARAAPLLGVLRRDGENVQPGEDGNARGGL